MNAAQNSKVCEICRVEIRDGDNRQTSGEDNRAALVAEPFVSAIQ